LTCKRSLVRVQCRPPPTPGEAPRSSLSGRRTEESRDITTVKRDPEPLTGARLAPGRALPLGARADDAGTAFSVFSRLAERIELCLFDEHGRETRFDLPERSGAVWHGYAPGVGPGQRYGYRVHGPWNPAAGLRCNPRKLLLDPYARAIDGELRWTDAIHGQARGHPNAAQVDDSAPDVPRSIVIDEAFDWAGDSSPAIPPDEAVIYETHVKGFTMRHPGVPESLRGTYAGLAHPAAIEHLVSLGVTSIELLPVHQFAHDGHLLDRGLSNYWGYNSIGFFAPHGEYAASGSGGGQVAEFKSMVRSLHAAGLEVILDVVYNHTGEGDERGPTLSMRGLDNVSYYRLRPDDRARYVDFAGTGNTLDLREPYVLQLVMDSLRYWLTEMHVDGFRFDLATALARESDGFDRGSAFFDVIQQDPVIGRAKLIAEPWDLGPDGYRVGDFPDPWAEWNGRYRDTVRDLWQGQPDMLHDFGRRFTGSADLYADEGRAPTASINFVTAHDGFTLLDLVSYARKHNEANGDANRDGESHNRSWNSGVEGPTTDPEVRALRGRQQRNMLATLLLSQGVPMILGGDELGRTQQGNNNGYCQDSELSWYDWEAADRELLADVRHLIALRREHPVFRRRRWVQVDPVADASHIRDIEWCTIDGERMRDEQWHTDGPGAIAIYLSGRDLVDSVGEPFDDDAFYLAFNATDTALIFLLPNGWLGARWSLVLDTASRRPFETRAGEPFDASAPLRVSAHSLILLQRLDEP
jgi:isoamylase